MTPNRPPRSKLRVRILLAACLIGLAGAAHADEREDLERLRATVLNLLDALVKNGVLPREKVDRLMRDSETMATARLAQMGPAASGAAVAGAAVAAAEVGADGKKVLRVPYVPEAVKNQIRDQVKSEVLAEVKNERENGNGLGSGLQSGARIQIEGDVRVRGEATRLDHDNTKPSAFAAAGGLTRAPDFLALGGSGKDIYTANTNQDTERARVRARLAVTAEPAPGVKATVGIATGTTSGPTTSNQTLGAGAGGSPDYFNKYSVVLDRASLSYQPANWLSLSGGRMRNPFSNNGSDLVWADDLNFDGVAVSLRPRFSDRVDGFLTAGWFPLSPSVPKQSSSRSLVGVQTGADWQFGLRDNHLRLTAGLYAFHGVEGVGETADTFRNLPDYVTRSEYGSGYRQRGNTLFRLNAPLSVDSATNWGLASRFRELDIAASVDLAQFDPLRVVASAEVVKNLGFKRSELSSRARTPILDGKSFGYTGKLLVGQPTIVKPGQWNAYVSYRYLGSDAVLDAFTSSDFGQGGTNSKGTVLGASYGLARNTWMSARWLASDLIESSIPATAAPTPAPKSKFSVDVIQVDLNTRF